LEGGESLSFSTIILGPVQSRYLSIRSWFVQRVGDIVCTEYVLAVSRNASRTITVVHVPYPRIIPRCQALGCISSIGPRKRRTNHAIHPLHPPCWRSSTHANRDTTTSTLTSTSPLRSRRCCLVCLVFFPWRAVERLHAHIINDGSSSTRHRASQLDGDDAPCWYWKPVLLLGSHSATVGAKVGVVCILLLLLPSSPNNSPTRHTLCLG